MAVIATILNVALVVFFVTMWLRFVFDWVRVLSPRWRPRGAALVIAELSYTVTDPPIRLVRRAVPPLRVGGVALDFAWSIVLLACIILLSVVGQLGSLG